MTGRPYTVLSCGMSLDGHLDDATDRRLVPSNDADLDRSTSSRRYAATTHGYWSAPRSVVGSESWPGRPRRRGRSW